MPTPLHVFDRDRDLSDSSREELEWSMDVLYPRTWQEWVQRYEELEAAYVGEPYSLAQIKRDHLFRALDDDGKVLAVTRRLTRDVQHVVNTDAAALTGGTLGLVAAKGAPADAEEAGWAIWERSDVQEQKGRWGRRYAALGDLHLEAILDAEGRGRLVYYDPQCVLLTYDAETGTHLERADIRIQYFDPPHVDEYGHITDVNTRSHCYVRTITPKRIDVWVDGEHQTRQSGPNKLGVVTLVHVPFIPWKEPEHGLWAASGLEAPLGLVDSLLTMVAAIGTRHANPLLACKGFKLGTDSDVFKHGRVLNGIPVDGSAEYVEIQANVVRLLEAVEQERMQVRATLPEFLFSDSGANESGEARSYRAAAFEGKIEDVRGRLYPAIARATQFAYHLERGEPYDDEAAMFTVDAPPVLPRNAATELKALNEVFDRKMILRVDYVRHLQRLGLVDEDHTPEEYAELLDEMSADRATAFFGPGGGGAQVTEEEAAAAPPAAQSVQEAPDMEAPKLQLGAPAEEE